MAPVLQMTPYEQSPHLQTSIEWFLVVLLERVTEGRSTTSYVFFVIVFLHCLSFLLKIEIKLLTESPSFHFNYMV